MDIETRKLLEASDCSKGFEIPNDDWETFPWKQYMLEIVAIQEEIQDKLGINFKRDGNVQDASYIEELFIRDNEPSMYNGSLAILTQIGIMFSHFGKLYTIWSNKSLDEDKFCVPKIKTIIARHGWIYVSLKALSLPYDGTNSALRRDELTWLSRFFSYL